jgi:hypothetical protein
MNKENFIKAFNAFAEDDYETSKEVLSKELDSSINDYFKRELELQNDVFTLEKPEE